MNIHLDKVQVSDLDTLAGPMHVYGASDVISHSYNTNILLQNKHQYSLENSTRKMNKKVASTSVCVNWFCSGCIMIDGNLMFSSKNKS